MKRCSSPMVLGIYNIVFVDHIPRLNTYLVLLLVPYIVVYTIVYVLSVVFLYQQIPDKQMTLVNIRVGLRTWKCKK